MHSEVDYTTFRKLLLGKYDQSNWLCIFSKKGVIDYCNAKPFKLFLKSGNVGEQCNWLFALNDRLFQLSAEFCSNLAFNLSDTKSSTFGSMLKFEEKLTYQINLQIG